MTFQEKFDELHKDFAKKSDEYIKADRSLSDINGFGDAQAPLDFINKKQEWQLAANNYHNFLTYFKNSGKGPSDTFS